VDGSAEAASLTKSNNIQVPWSFSPDGTRLAYHELNSTTGFDLWTLPVQHTERGLVAGPPELFLGTPAYETYPAFSPDGRWIAYGSGAVYVRPFPANGSNEVRVSDSGGRIPFWMPNGRELLYRTDDQRVMVVPYSVEGTKFVAGKPRPWTTVQLGDTGVISNLDLDQATGRVLGLMPADGDRNRQSPNHVTIRLNAVDDIGRRVLAASR
jgi:serine/threonine-protein kinase